MDAAASLEPWISEPMTWEEIRERHPDQHVCCVEMEWVSVTSFATARVIGVGNTFREAFDHAQAWRGRYRTMGHYSTRNHTPRFVLPRLVMTDEIRDLLRNRR